MPIRVICALIFLFLIAPILDRDPAVSFNAEPYFTFTEKMLRLRPRRAIPPAGTTCC